MRGQPGKDKANRHPKKRSDTHTHTNDKTMPHAQQAKQLKYPQVQQYTGRSKSCSKPEREHSKLAPLCRGEPESITVFQHFINPWREAQAGAAFHIGRIPQNQHCIRVFQEGADAEDSLCLQVLIRLVYASAVQHVEKRLEMLQIAQKRSQTNCKLLLRDVSGEPVCSCAVGFGKDVTTSGTPHRLDTWPWVKSPYSQVNIPIPTIGSKMGGEFTYPKIGSQNGFDNHSHLERLQSNFAPQAEPQTRSRKMEPRGCQRSSARPATMAPPPKPHIEKM